MKTKTCSECKIERDVSLFYKRHNTDSLQSWCKFCVKKYKNNYNKLHRLKLLKIYREYSKKYHKKHKRDISSRHKKWYKLNRLRILNRTKKYYQKNKDKKKQYSLKNKDKISKRMKKYKIVNKIKLNKYRKNLLKTDINFKMACNLRVRIWYALRGSPKLSATMKLVGCSIECLKQHLEKQFKFGMSWANYGTGWNGKGMQEWHIDHIIPCASFDLSQPEEQKKCFHYTNLQPLWAEENWSKGSKILRRLS